MKETTRLVSAENNNQDHLNLRPSTLAEFIGQSQLKQNLTIFIEAAKRRNGHLDHTLMYGPPGLGKTTLAEIIANEMKSNFKIAAGPTLTKAGDLAAILTNLEEKDVLFIDEIHRLNISVEEILYSAMEDFKLDIIIGEGPSARSIRIDLPRFTLVGATTRQGLISNPLRDRFGIICRLEFYTQAELQTVLTRTAKLLQTQITQDGAMEIAKRSRSTPRIANSLLKRVCDFLEISTKNTIDQDLAKLALDQLGVDEEGFDSLDRQYLDSIVSLYGGGPVGIDTLASVLSENKGTIEDTIEPYLLKNGFIIKTPRGRVVTNKVYQYFNLTPPIKPNETEFNFE